MKPLVSIIVTCYNKRPYLDATLESVENQTYGNIETILVDDGSTDGSGAWLEAYVTGHDKVTLVRQANQGVSAARNAGIRASHGEYVMSLDADDMIAPSYVERCADFLSAHPEVKLVYTKGDMFGSREGDWDIPSYSYEEQIWSNLVFVSAMYRRSDFDRTVGYHENMRHGLEDWDFWLTLLSPEDKVHRIDEVLFHWRIVENSRSVNAERHEMECYRQLFNNHKDVYSSYTDQLVYYREKWAQYELLYDNLSCVQQSKAYRFGKLFTRPMVHIKRLFKDGK